MASLRSHQDCVPFGTCGSISAHPSFASGFLGFWDFAAISSVARYPNSYVSALLLRSLF